MMLGDQFGARIAGLLLVAVRCQAQTESLTAAPEPHATLPASNPPLTGLAPLTLGERSKYALKRSFGPQTVGLAAFTSGLQTWRGVPEEWGQDWGGYTQRFGMRMGRSVVGTGIEFGVGAALNTDPRYRRLGHGGFGKRLKYALGAAFYHHDSHGNRVPAIARFAGIAGSNIITNNWMPPGDNSKTDVLRRSGQQLGWHIGWTILREFTPDIRRKLGR